MQALEPCIEMDAQPHLQHARKLLLEDEAVPMASALLRDGVVQDLVACSKGTSI